MYSGISAQSGSCYCYVKPQLFPSAVPMSGLYFTLDGTVYLPGETVIITGIGDSRTNPAGPSLVCVTSNVNTGCCRNSDGPGDSGGVGEWYFPNGTMVPRNRDDPLADFTRSGFLHQVWLNRRNNAMSPTGAYECRVPDTNASQEGVVNVTSAQITVGE